MLIAVVILLAGVLTGWAGRGRLRRLAEVRVRLWPLAFAALALQEAPIPRGAGLARYLPVAALLLSYALLLWVCVANLRLRGFRLVALGFALNLLPIAANAGMPVSAAALRAAGHAEDIAVLREREPGEKHHLATSEDVLRPLGDVIPVPEPVGAVVSVGDLIAWGGVAWFVSEAMAGRTERTERPGRRRRRATTSGTPR